MIEGAATEVFAAHGYQGASIEEIARRSGVTPPVVYDHFESKLDLYRRLLERHFAELREIWLVHFAGEAPLEQRISGAVDTWFAYVETHPFAARTLFRDSSGDPQVAEMHAGVAAASRDALLPALAAESYASEIGATDSRVGLEMAWVVLREVLQGLAIWWSERPDVPREEIVRTAMNALWIGFERVGAGEEWGSGRRDSPKEGRRRTS